MDEIIEKTRALAKDETCRKQIIDDLRKLALSLEMAPDTMQRLSYVQLEPVIVRVGLNLNIFNLLGESNESLTVNQLAVKTGAAPVLIGRILRYLSSVGAIEEISKGSFKANNITVSLSDPGVQSALYHFVDNMGPVNLSLPKFLEKNQYQDITDPANTAFGMAFDTDIPAFLWMRTQPERYEFFNRYMQAEQKGLPLWQEVYPIESKSQGLSPEQVFFVDIGGGVGHQAVAMKKWLPQVNNRIIVQDQGIVVPHAIKHQGVEAMAYDFFQPQPIKGARIYYMRSIIHDWPDDKAAEILKNTISALGPDSVILIDDRVLPNAGAHWYATSIDMTMMSALAARERTVEQWDTLMEKAGLKIQSTCAYTDYYHSIIECIPIA